MKKLGVSEEFPDYSDVNYWNNRYTKEKNEVTTWLQPYSKIKPLLMKYFGKKYSSEILVIGCGNSC